MRTKLLSSVVWLLFFTPVLSFAAAPSLNNSDYLIINSGETLEASGVVYKNVSIVVQPGGRISLPANSSTDSNKWSLQLVAPNVYIGGTLCADGVSFNTSGIGSAGSGGTMGPGGSGFGGVGGVGNDNPGSGGSVYGPTYQTATGSKGINNSHGGGGSLRIDAMSLTLTSYALLLARASQYTSHTSGGGSSGGCILTNGIMTSITSFHSRYPTFHTEGGPGQLAGLYFNHTILTISYGGGGGGGGKIKFFQFPNKYVNDGITYADGGASGGGTATAGGTGAVNTYTSYSPTTPSLLAPDNGQEVGLQPTLNFSTADNQASQFMQYQIVIYPNASPNTVNASQLDPNSAGFAGWKGVPFFKSSQMASYTLPWRLTGNTTYYWYVKATNNLGASWSTISSLRTFHTNPNNPPLQPALLSPVPTPVRTDILKTPTFTVLCADPDGNSLTFSIILSQDPTLSNPKIIQPTYSGWDQESYPSAHNYAGITATCQLAEADALEPGATYYWKATAYDQLQEATASPLASFSVVPLPSTPLLLGPAAQSVVTTLTPTLQMSATTYTSAAVQYKLEISSDNFQTVMTYTSENGQGWSQPQYASGQTALLQIPAANALSTGQTYQWRVTAYDTYGNNWSQTSEEREFTVVIPPNLPQLVAPGNHYQASDASLPFQFQAVSGAGNTLTYRFELSTDNFTALYLTFDQGITQGWSAPAYASGALATFVLPPSANLVRGQTYQWRVQAWDGYSWSPRSEIRTFSLASSLELTKVKLFPSPAISTDTLHILLYPSVDAEVQMQVFNAQAKEIQHAAWSITGGHDNDYAYSIRGFAPGPYFAVLTLKSAFGTKKFTQRFVVVN